MIVIVPLLAVVCIFAWMLKPGRKPTNSRKIAILATTIPPFILAIAAVVFQLSHNAAGKTWVSDISNTIFIVGFGLTCVAILVLVGFAIARRWEIVKGLGFGICIAVVVDIIEAGMLEWLGGV